jgi:hypothetical protein
VQAALAGAVYFLAIYVVGFALGALRVLFVTPRLGATAAVLAELPLMLTASWIACRCITRRMSITFRPSARLAMGASAFVLLMLVETEVGMVAFGQTLAAQTAALCAVAGLIGLGGQVMFALFPLIQLKLPRPAR